jgi:hypothetical protein
MLWVKSALTGAICAPIGTALAIAVRIFATMPTDVGSVGLDLSSIVKHWWSLWLIALASFGIGFYWQYRRTRFRY